MANIVENVILRVGVAWAPQRSALNVSDMDFRPAVEESSRLLRRVKDGKATQPRIHINNNKAGGGSKLFTK